MHPCIEQTFHNSTPSEGRDRIMQNDTSVFGSDLGLALYTICCSLTSSTERLIYGGLASTLITEGVSELHDKSRK